MTTSDYLEQLVQDRDDLVDNLTTKGITGLTGDETFTELVPEVLNIPSGGGGAVEEKDVNFYDYDGTLTNSYTAQEFLALTSMPENPTHEGLTAQGWNWSLADAKSYVTDYGICDIGQMYITDDGITKIYIELNNDLKEPCLAMGINGTVTVNWGDNNEEEITGNNVDTLVITQHTYQNSGNYVIKITPDENTTIAFGSSDSSKRIICNPNKSNNAYKATITKIEFGKNIAKLNIYAISLPMLASVTIPNNISNMSYISYAYRLKCLILPNSVSFCGVDHCTSLSKLIIPKSITTLSIQYNYALQSITIPNNVNLTKFNFTNSYSLYRYVIPSNIKTLDWMAFQYNYALKEIVLPNTMTSINQTIFQNCENLVKVILPNSITNIPNYVFQYCRSLVNVVIPSGVTSVGNEAFRDCTSLQYCDFSECLQIPTLANKNTFQNIPSDCKIIVPDALYEDWIVATNWSDTSIVSHIIKKSDWDALQE